MNLSRSEKKTRVHERKTKNASVISWIWKNIVTLPYPPFEKLTLSYSFTNQNGKFAQIDVSNASEIDEKIGSLNTVL